MTGPNSHEGWFLDFPSRVLECLEVRLLLPTEWPTDSDEPLHCRVPGTISSSMSSMSSDMMKCCGVALPPMKVGSRFRDKASDGRPGLLTMVKPVRISICCQRLSLSRRAAVTSPRACLDTNIQIWCQQSIKTGIKEKNTGNYSLWLTLLPVFCGQHHPGRNCEPHGKFQRECSSFSLSSLPGKTKPLSPHNIPWPRLQCFRKLIWGLKSQNRIWNALLWFQVQWVSSSSF